MKKRLLGEGGFNSRFHCIEGEARTKACGIWFALYKETDGIVFDARIHHGNSFVEVTDVDVSKDVACMLLQEKEQGRRSLCTLISAASEIPVINFCHGVEIESDGAYMTWRGRKVHWEEQGDIVVMQDPFIEGMTIDMDTTGDVGKSVVEAHFADALDKFHPDDDVLGRKMIEEGGP